MCVSIENERGARNYINEILRVNYGIGYAKHTLESFQSYHGWLTDHEIRDGKLQPKFVATGKPGMEKIELGLETAVSRHHRLLQYA